MVRVQTSIRQSPPDLRPALDMLSWHDGLVQQRIEAVDGAHVRINGRWVLNFAACNYLGLNDDPRVLAAMSHPLPCAIALGMPRLLAAAEPVDRLERAIAALVGQEAAVIFTSTTHAAHDGLGMLAGHEGHFFIDRAAYPISVDAAYSVARAQPRVHWFAHNDPADLERLLRRLPSQRGHVIVCDGVYPGEGILAPLPAMLELADQYDAWLYIDDAHGIGVLGSRPAHRQPLGVGGSGTPSRLGVRAGRYLHVGSLSKAFGTPIGFAAGPDDLIGRLGATAPSFVHNSQPAVPLVAAALAALEIHQREGDDRRQLLINAVCRFRTELRRWGVQVEPHSCFPIQELKFSTVGQAQITANALRRKGIWAIVHGSPFDVVHGGTVRFVFSAAHAPSDIDEAVSLIAQVWRNLAKSSRVHQRDVKRCGRDRLSVRH